MKIAFALILSLVLAIPLSGGGALAAGLDDLVRQCQAAYSAYVAAPAEARPSLALAAKDVCTQAMAASGLTPDAFWRTYLSGLGTAAAPAPNATPAPNTAPAPSAAPLPAQPTFTPAPATPMPVPAGRMALGTNVAGPDDWSTELPFADVFKMSRRWFGGSTTAWQDDRALDLDDHGWVRSLQPGQVARTLLFWPPQGMIARFPSGSYLFQYAGSGTIQTTENVRRTPVGPGQETWDVDATHGVGIFITATDPADPIRDMHLWLPGVSPSDDPFYPTFIARTMGYRVVRFYNWEIGQNRQEYQPRTWAGRPRVGDARWNVRGVPVEIQVALADRLHADAWVNIPHTVDDDYIRSFAIALRDGLDPDLKVYVEYSDEIWNDQHVVATYAREQGIALGLAADPYLAQLRYDSYRSVQIFRIFEDVLPRERLVRVIASQFGNPWTSEAELSFADTAAHTDVLAVAPYFGFLQPELHDVASYTLDHLFDQMRTVVLPRVRDAMARQLDIARRHGVQLVAYEGGQTLVAIGPDRDRLTPLFRAANRDPRMGELYTRDLQDWNEVVGTTFVHLSNCFADGGNGASGFFGALEYIAQPREEAYKYDALMRWIEGR